MLIGVLMMVKNEQESIKLTIDSTKNYFKNIIVFDTGSTDNTVQIIKDTCAKNKQVLHLKEGHFKSFPESRNEALEFANTFPFKYILMMDAGDEFQTKMTLKEFNKFIESIPTHVDIGIVKQKWLEKKDASLSDHFDCRFIKNHFNIKYDLTFPVHEQVCNADSLSSSNFGDAFWLYQDRMKFGGSSEKRYARDIEMLSKAVQNKRNLYFLAQSYMSVNDFKNGFKYNVLSYQHPDTFFDETFTLVRIAFCAIQIKMFDIAVKYLEMLLKLEETPIDAYIYYFDIHIKLNKIEKVVPYIKILYNLEKPGVQSSIKLTNHYFYDYLRYNLLSIACLLANKELEIGKAACLKALPFNKPDDLHNIKIYNQF
jgi:glycosyltransferase involved in cell wall biosynthesis